MTERVFTSHNIETMKEFALKGNWPEVATADNLLALIHRLECAEKCAQGFIDLENLTDEELGWYEAWRKSAGRE